MTISMLWDLEQNQFLCIFFKIFVESLCISLPTLATHEKLNISIANLTGDNLRDGKIYGLCCTDAAGMVRNFNRSH